MGIPRFRSSKVASLLCLVSLGLSAGMLAVPNVADAATRSAGSLQVSPALTNLQLSSGETSTTVMTTVTNLTSSPLVIDVSVRDFSTQPNQPGSILLFGPKYDPSSNAHSLQTVASLAASQITLAAHASQKVPVTLSDLGQLAPGGHYGAVLFSPESLAAQGSKPKVSIQSAIASLIFLKTAGGGTQSLQLSPFSTGTLRFSLPGTTYLNFNNSGNSQSAPDGQLTLYSPGGSILSTTVINPGSGLVLPGTSRLFNVVLPLSHSWLAVPGMYRLELKYRANTQSAFTVVSQHFFYLNLQFIFLVLVLIGLLYYALKRFGRRALKLTADLLFNLASLLRKKRQKKYVPVEPVKPKKPTGLIQG